MKNMSTNGEQILESPLSHKDQERLDAVSIHYDQIKQLYQTIDHKTIEHNLLITALVDEHNKFLAESETAIKELSARIKKLLTVKIVNE